jgi:hypothetical protein
MQFNWYTRDELENCGVAFAKAFGEYRWMNRAEWTAQVFQWFANTAASWTRVYSTKVDEAGSEFLVDQCHLRFPANAERRKRYEAMLGNCNFEMPFALESEWATGSDDHRYCEILNDACKLTVVRAKAKVMIFGSDHGSDRDDLFDALKSLRHASGDDVPWLCIDVPYGVKEVGITTETLP